MNSQLKDLWLFLQLFIPFSCIKKRIWVLENRTSYVILSTLGAYMLKKVKCAMFNRAILRLTPAPWSIDIPYRLNTTITRPKKSVGISLLLTL